MADKYKILWAPAVIDDLDGILDYLAAREGPEAAINLYGKISSRIDALFLYPMRCRVVPELEQFGIRAYRELIARPYRIFIRVKPRTVSIIGIIDGRRDLEELLIHRIMDKI